MSGQLVASLAAGWLVVLALGPLVRGTREYGNLSQSKLARALKGARSYSLSARRLLGQVPETIDLLCLAFGAGEGVAGSLRLVAERGPVDTARLMNQVVHDLDSGLLLDSALSQIPGLLGAPYEPICHILRSSLANGAPVGELVVRLGDEAHQARKRQLEQRARQMPVLLLFPLVMFSLPALIIGAIVPLVIVSTG